MGLGRGRRRRFGGCAVGGCIVVRGGGCVFVLVVLLIRLARRRRRRPGVRLRLGDSLVDLHARARLGLIPRRLARARVEIVRLSALEVQGLDPELARLRIVVPSLGGIEVGVRNGGRIDGRIAGGTRLEIRVRHAERRRNLRASRDGRERLLHLPSIAVVEPRAVAPRRGARTRRTTTRFGVWSLPSPSRPLARDAFPRRGRPPPSAASRGLRLLMTRADRRSEHGRRERGERQSNLHFSSHRARARVFALVNDIHGCVSASSRCRGSCTGRSWRPRFSRRSSVASHRARAACVRGFHRYRIRDRVYPAIARHEDARRVDGYLLSSLTSRELAVLDWFEDEAYVMRSVRVELADGANAETIAYVYEDTRNLHGTWDYDEFDTRTSTIISSRATRSRRTSGTSISPATTRRSRPTTTKTTSRSPTTTKTTTAQWYNTLLHRSRTPPRDLAGCVSRRSRRSRVLAADNTSTSSSLASPSRLRSPPPRRGLLLDRPNAHPFPREFERGESILHPTPGVESRAPDARRGLRRRASTVEARDSRFDSTASRHSTERAGAHGASVAAFRRATSSRSRRSSARGNFALALNGDLGRRPS